MKLVSVAGFYLTVLSILLFFCAPVYAEDEVIISYVSGSGPFPNGTREIEMTISTNIAAKCKISPIDNNAVSSWPDYLVTDDHLSHHIRIALESDDTTQRYIRCRDMSTNVINTSSFVFPILFAGDSASSGGSGNNIPAIPQNFSVDHPNNSDGQFNLSWGAVSGASDYHLMEKQSDGLWTDVILIEGQLSVDLSRSQTGDYQYKIAACNNSSFAICSNFSDEIVVWVGVGQSAAEPVITYVSGSGPHPYGVGSIEMIVSTDINATCRANYQNTGGFDSWSKILSTQDNFLHRVNISVSGYGNTEKYIRCQALETLMTNTDSFVFPVSINPPIQLPTPDNFQVDNANNTGTYTLSWDSVDDAVTYVLKESPAGGEWSTEILSANMLSRLINKTVDGTYHYYLFACEDEAGLECGFRSIKLAVTVVGSSANNLPPVINSSPALSGTESVLYEYQLDATDPNVSDVLTYRLNNEPPGMSISADTGLIHWIPTTSQVGSHLIDITVDDNEGLSASQTYPLTIVQSNQAPFITSTEMTSATENLAYVYQVEASDNNAGDILTFSLSQSPGGMSIDSTSGLINWSPNDEQVGEHSITIVVSDLAGLTGTQSFILSVSNVNDAPEFTSNPITIAQELVEYTYQLVAIDKDNDPMVYALENVPTGMIITEQGLLSWMPAIDQEGSHNVSVSVTDPSFASNTQSFVIQVERRVNTAPVADELSLTTAEDASFNLMLMASDVDSDVLTYKVVSSPTNGQLTGIIPNLVYSPNLNFFGSDSFSFKVNDGIEDSNIATVNIEISSVNDAPIVNAQSINLNEDTRAEVNLTGSDVDSETIIFEIVTEPTNGILTGTSPIYIYVPNENFNGIDSFTFKGNDGALDSPVATVLIDVNSVNDAPQITSTPINFVLEGQQWVYTLLASDLDGDNLTYTMTQAPAGAVFDPQTHQVTWSTDGVVSEEFEFSFAVTDIGGLTTLQSVAVEVLSTERQVTHEGTEFWIPVSINAMSEAFNSSGGTFEVNLLSNGSDTEVILEIAALGIVENLFLTANQLTTYSLNLDDLALTEIFSLNKLLENHAIHITSDSPISAYFFNQKESSTDGFLGLPASSLGKEYIAATYTMLGRLGILRTVDGGQTGPIITIVATEDNTQVTIEAIMDILPGDQRQTEFGTPIELILNSGDVYNLETKGSFKADLTGSIIKADKPISVIGQMECVFIPVDNTACDHIIEQLPPIESLGTEYLTTPFWGRAESGRFWWQEYGDTFRVVAPYNNTEIYIDEVLRARLAKGEYYEFFANKPQHVKANHPVLMAQYSNGNQFDEGYRELENDYTDPFMVIVPPAEQFLKRYTFNTPARDLAFNFVNILVPTNAISTIKLDGQVIDGNLFVPIPNTLFSYIQLPVTTGSHQLEADEAFGAYFYGYDYFESYGYLGGMAFSAGDSVTSLTLSGDLTQSLDNEWCSEAQVLDEYGRPLHGVRIKFVVSGGTSLDAYPFTDAEGIARYCYKANKPDNNTVTASINNLTQTVNINWIMGIQNRPPVITSAPLLKVLEGESYSYSLLAEDPEGEALTYTLLEAPTGMTIDQFGQVNWSQVELSATKYNREKIILAVADPFGLSTQQSFELQELIAFNSPPEFGEATISLTATIGVPYVFNSAHLQTAQDYLKYQVLVDDADEDAVFVDILQGPEEAYIQRIIASHTTIIRENDPRSCVGCISYFRWFPENVGEQFFELGLRDARGGLTESRTFTVNVVPNSPPEIIDFNPASIASIGYEYSYILNIENDVPIHQFDNLDDLRVVFEQAPTNMTYQLVSANGTQKLRIRWFPASRDEGSNIIRLRVDDRLNSSAVKEFTINVIADNQPPIITVGNMPRAEATIPYQYHIDAFDPNSDELTYQLLIAPTGMTIDENTGVINWVPSVNYNDESEWVRYAVTDSQGLTAERSNLLYISRFFNQAPTFIPAYRPKFAKVGAEFVHQALATDREGDNPISYRLNSSASEPIIDSQNGTITWTPTAEGRFWLSVVATDNLDHFSSSNNEFWYVQVIPADATLNAQLELSPTNIIDLGETVTLSVVPENETSSVQATLTVDGISTPMDALLQARITPTRVGRIPVIATITDGVETIERTINIFVRDPADITPPIVDINSPTNLADISSPTDIFGTAQDDNLVEVLLLYKRADKPLEDVLQIEDFVELYRGPQSFANQAIARLDTSMLLNGTYHIYLQATDANGLTTGKISSVNVTGDLKVGNFSITLEDLNIPLAGFPITVTRTYDSRRKNDELDFGYGWSIDYQNVRLQESNEPTKGWSQVNGRGTFEVDGQVFNSSAVCIYPTSGKSVTVTMPNGDTEKFIVSAKTSNGSPASLEDPNCFLFSDRFYDVFFTASAGTQSTLTSNDGGSLYLSELDNGFLAQAGDGEAWPITNYTLTTRSGYVYQLNQDFGVELITDPNGNTLTYSNTGIVHSSGISVVFNRNAQGQITSLTTPNNDTISYQYNANGDLQSMTDELLGVSRYSYNTEHGLTDMFDALGRKIIKNIYNDEGRLIAQEDDEGHRTNFDHDLVGRQSVVTDRLGRTIVLYYDEQGSVTSQVDALNNITSFTFDDNGNQLSKIDALNRETKATYNDNDDQLTQTDALDNTVYFTYNTRGQELTITDESGDVFTNQYVNGNLMSISDPLGNVVSNTMVPGTGLPGTITDALGYVTNITYAKGGRKGKETNALGDYTIYAYDENGNVKSETRSRRLVDNTLVEEVTTFEYDKRNRLIKTTDVLGHVSQVEYDLAGNQTASIDALNRRTEINYDVYGRMVETRYSDNTSESKTYDAEGNVLTEIDRLARVTEFEYDALNRVIKTTFADNSFTETEYDVVGQVTAQIDANGNRTSFEYDLAGRRIKSTDALNHVHQFAYDVDGNLVNETNALNHTVNYVYDSLDRKTQTTFANNSIMQTGFDALARKTSSTDQANVTTDYAYDAIGRLISVTDVEGNVTSYTYDEAGNKLTQTDAEGRTTTWSYDALGRVLTRTLPMGQVESFSYDEVGNMLTRTDFNGELTTYDYDINNRVTLITYVKDASTESFTYDDLGNQLTSTNTQGDDQREWVYSYDVMNRLASETKPNGEVLSYLYDTNGNKTQLKVTYANGDVRIENSTYDALNRLDTVTDADGNETTYGYDAVGNRISVMHSNANITSYVYDELNRLTQMQDKQADESIYQQFDYELHVTGRRAKLTELNGRVSTYTYDSLYRLTDEAITDSVNGDYLASYSFDKVGNRTDSTINGVSTVYTYDNNDRLTQEGGEVYTYDDNGNTLSKTIDSDITTYIYDPRQKLIFADIFEGGVTKTSNYRYNVAGIRTQKIEDGITTNYLIDSNQSYAQVIAESDDTDTLQVEYIFGDDLLAQKRGTVLSHYQYDGLGSTRTLTDSTGVVTDSYYYDAFGVTLATEGSTVNDYLFTGEQFDSGLGNYYLRARYYDQSVGRFTQQDTWMGNNSDPITLHKYLYGNADGVNNIDPSGHFSLSELGTTINTMGRLVTSAMARTRNLFSSGSTNFASGAMRVLNASKNYLRVILRRCGRGNNSNKCNYVKGWAEAYAKMYFLAEITPNTLKRARKYVVIIGAFDIKRGRGTAAFNGQVRANATLQRHARTFGSYLGEQGACNTTFTTGRCAEWRAARNLIRNRSRLKNIRFIDPRYIEEGSNGRTYVGRVRPKGACDICRAAGFTATNP